MKKLLCLLLSSSMILSFNTTVFADETSTEDKSSSTWLESQLEGTFSDLEFQLADVPDSSVALNLQYARLQSSIMENGYGENYSITLPDSVSISGNASDLFEKEFGDIDFSLEKVEIPKDFNVENILKDSKELINKEYGDFVNSEGFKDIYNNISTYQENNSIKESLSINNVINMVGSANLSALVDNSNNRGDKKNEYKDKANEHESFYEEYSNPYSSEMEETKNLIDDLAEQAYKENGSAVSVVADADTLAALKDITNSSLGDKGWEERLEDMYAIFNEETNKNEGFDLPQEIIDLAANQMSLGEISTYLDMLGQDGDSYSANELESARMDIAKILGISGTYEGQDYILSASGREYLIKIVVNAFKADDLKISDFTLEEIYVKFKYNLFNNVM